MTLNINYKNFEFFKKSHELTKLVYKLTNKFPKDERFGLISQLRRASSSIPSNIAEGSGRSTLRDFRSFLHNALGSAKEVEYQLLLSKDLEYIDDETYNKLILILNEVIGKLKNYIKTID